VHIAAIDQLGDWAIDIPDIAYELAERFWPGPLTLILKRAAHVSDQITGGQNTVGIRIPAHPLALELLTRFGPLAAPSANRFGRLSPTSYEAVAHELAAYLGNDLAVILDGGPCQVGIESTIVSLVDQVKILRPGMITAEQITAVATSESFKSDGADSQSEIRVPGALPSHYAPETRLTVASADTLIELVLEFTALSESTAVIASAATIAKIEGSASGNTFCRYIVAPHESESYARFLYEQLRQLDLLKLDRIFVEEVPAGGSWDGVRDRLQRASAESG
jgi:L-threonylcarbamoyladenylate synthase